MVLVVNKKVNSRYYNVLKESQGGKFPPKVENVNSGSILVEPLSSDNSYDFHLAAQYVTQGTCTPTLFRVAYDTTKMPQEALINFTFEQCFNYYNWEGAVRVPACLQCADKLSKLVSMHVKESIKENAVTKKHFFL
jgi:aubergine-like protein